ncbi:MAG: hypothetical protein Q9216_001582 [Gyalolechia sp. 2 TL-2023]
MDVQRYLLDQSQIRETLQKLYWGFDTARFDVLRKEIFAGQIELDFTALFGGEVQTFTNEELVQYWIKLKTYSTMVQHSLMGVLPFLPSPAEPSGTTKEAPDRVDVFANVLVYLRRDVHGAESEEARCESTLDVEVKRLPGNVTTGNPWRISKLKANVVRTENYAKYWRDL